MSVLQQMKAYLKVKSKHFFAVFRIHPTWKWTALPSTYLKGPRLTLDKQAFDDYFCSSQPTQMISSATSASSPDENENRCEDFTASIPKHKVLKKLNVHVLRYTYPLFTYRALKRNKKKP